MSTTLTDARRRPDQRRRTSFELEFLGAAGEVTGSLYRLRTPGHSVLLECGLRQGGRNADAQNAEPFPFDVGEIDAVVLSHAHIDQ